MRQSDISSPLLPCLLGMMLMASTPVEAQTTAGADGPVSEYPAAFFEPAQPYSAFDMIARLPGFTFYGGDQDVRGFSGASGNVLIDGERPTGKQETLEGDWKPHRMAVLRFPSYEQAKAFYDGEMYRQARGFREGATEYFNMVLVEGVPAPV